MNWKDLTPEQRQPIAEMRFDFVLLDDVRGSVRAWIGRPFQHSQGYSVCPCGLEGLDSDPFVICGEEHFQALSLALKFIYLRLVAEFDDGVKFFHPGTPELVSLADLDPIFGCGD